MRYKLLLITTSLLVAASLVITPVSRGQMAHMNRLVDLLAGGQAIFGSFSGSHDAAGAAATIANRDLDFVFYSMEALQQYNIPNLRAFIQFMNVAGVMQNRYDIRTDYPLLVRIPPLEEDPEEGQRRVGEVLNAGAFGIVFPQLNTPEDAKLAIDSMRYSGLRQTPQARGRGGRGPGRGGRGGTAAAPPIPAASYWGMSQDEYKERADLWPSNPNGELINMLLIENQEGIANAREIVRTPGVSIAVPGPGDLSQAYNRDMEAVEKAIQTVLAACKEFNVACGITANTADIERRLSEGFRVIIADAEANRIGMGASGRRD
jgi:4-hydroxy-2-oxoheptanedioate aldolase